MRQSTTSGAVAIPRQHWRAAQAPPARASRVPAIDSVHQGDLDGRKGVYEVNLVDEVTQYEFVAAVEGISERFLVPALEALMDAFPFEVKGFHSDNGSEYINYRVARLLRKLHVEEFTKSRPRRSNDNALVESKNASRRHLGHSAPSRRPRQWLPARRAAPYLMSPLPPRDHRPQGTHEETLPLRELPTAR